MTDKKYTEADIEVLSDRDHVRLRLPVYAGSTSKHEYSIPLFTNNEFHIKNIEFIPATYKCIGEILDNSIDEFAQITTSNKMISIEAQPLLGTYTISDNGRGVPIGKHATGKYTPELVFGSLRSGRNFSNDKDSGVIGQNGMGSSITNFCSTEFNLDIRRDGKKYHQTFTDGALHISKPSIRKTTMAGTGTTVNFQLDNQVFNDISLPNELLENRALEIALTNPGVTTSYNGKRYKFRKGFEDIVKKLSEDYFKFELGNIEYYVIFDMYEGIDEKIFSWVNSSLLFDGGLCNTQFLNAFYDKVTTSLVKDAKKNKCEVTKNDVRQNLLVLGNLKVSDPEYDAQSKTRLTGPNLRKEMGDLLEENWTMFSRRNKDWFTRVLERSIIRHHTIANKKAIKDHQKNQHKKVPGLVDATSKNRFECQLLVTEGDSAASMITDARNPKTTGSMPLRGKINNVYGTTTAQLLKMGKVADLLTSIGLVPGRKAARNELRYGRVVIATDADVDGSDIFTLLINLFYQFWPELFDPAYEPFIYRLIAPNVCLTKKGAQRIHCTSLADYNLIKSKYKNWTVNYYKGLGSMVRADWEMILSGDTDSQIPIVDNGDVKETLQLLFSNDTNARKGWLQND